MSTRFFEQAVKDTLGKFILTFWNSYNFFTTYASLDKFDIKKDGISFEKRRQFLGDLKNIEIFFKILFLVTT